MGGSQKGCLFLSGRGPSLAGSGHYHSTTTPWLKVARRLLSPFSWRTKRPANGQDIHLRRRGDRPESGLSFRLAIVLAATPQFAFATRSAGRHRSGWVEADLH